MKPLKPPPLPEAHMIRLSAEGMIRNHGWDAIREAEAAAQRHADTEGHGIWQAIAQEIRAINASTIRLAS